ncbi:hypothetical protein ES703_125010 [subsurface metagenome]
MKESILTALNECSAFSLFHRNKTFSEALSLIRRKMIISVRHESDEACAVRSSARSGKSCQSDTYDKRFPEIMDYTGNKEVIQI